MDQSQCAVTSVDRINHDAQTENIYDLVQRGAFAPHLLIDAVQMFFARIHPPFDTRFLQRSANAIRDLADELLLIAACALQRLFDDAVAPWIQRLEAELFEFGLDRMNAKPVGDGAIDL